MTVSELRLHADIAPFEVQEGVLCVGGRTVIDIMRETGMSPAYVYDSRLIERRIRYLREVLPGEISLHYAVKANPMPAVVEAVSRLVDGLDVASHRELAIAQPHVPHARDISFAGPGKSDADLHAALRAGVTVNVESEGELRRLLRIGTQLGQRPQVAIRVNPDFELRSSGMKMSGGPKQFGIDAEQVPSVLAALSADQVDFVGFHIFSGSQNLSESAICESQTKAAELALRLSTHAPSAPKTINIGGGFGIPYFPGDQPLDLNSIGKNLHNVLARVHSQLPNVELVIELGRYIVGEAGVYLCTVIDRKVSRNEVFLVTNGGLHHHLAASGNFGQVLRKNYPVCIANRIGSADEEVASVVGPLCTPLDLLANRMRLARADEGDIVAVFQSGAYGFSASPHQFLSHPPPSELLL